MEIFDTTNSINLLKRAHQSNIVVALKDDNISLSVPQGYSIDEQLLSDIKQNKIGLVKYLKEYASASETKNQISVAQPAITKDTRVYYHITSTQRYWVDDQIDKEYKIKDPVHGTIIYSYRVAGEIQFRLLSQCMTEVLNRHESLRSTFCKIDGNYYLHVEPVSSSKFEPTYIDVSGSNGNNDDLIADLYLFTDHIFDLQEGPLFLVRLLKIDDFDYIISFKIHHVICDGWSSEVLIRDFFNIYNSLNNQTYEFSALKYTYKDYLYITRQNALEFSERDREYWTSLYKSLPPPLLLKDVARVNSDISKKTLASESIERLTGNPARLQSLAGNSGVSLFVILQALLYMYLRTKHGAYDILVGTFVFGRDYPESEDHIGCFAKTMLIRTVLQENESFKTVLEKVKKSNEEMNLFAAYTLMDHLSSMLPEPDRSKCFWNINVQYADLNRVFLNSKQIGSLSDKLGAKFMKIPIPGNAIIGNDMQFYFFRRGDQLGLEIQYDQSLYNQRIICNLLSEFQNYIETCVE